MERRRLLGREEVEHSGYRHANGKRGYEYRKDAPVCGRDLGGTNFELLLHSVWLSVWCPERRGSSNSRPFQEGLTLLLSVPGAFAI